MCSEAVKREPFDDINNSSIVNQSYSVGEDRVFNLALFEKAQSFLYTPMVLYFYSKRINSSTNSNTAVDNFFKKYGSSIYNNFIDYGIRHSVHKEHFIQFHSIINRYFYYMIDALSIIRKKAK